MIKNYLLVTWRYIVRNKTNSIINIAGLTVSMASFMFILMYVQDELKFDTFLENADRVYQVNLDADFGEGNKFNIGKTPASVCGALVRNIPEIEVASRVYRPGNLVVRSG